MGPQGLAQALLGNLTQAPNSIVVDDRQLGRKWTKKAFLSEVDRSSELFQRADPGLAIVCCSISTASLVSIIAALGANHAVFLIDQNTNAEHLTKLVERYDPAIVIAAPHPIAGYEPIGAGILRRTARSTYTQHQDLAILLSTSGSTASPKAVRLSGEAVHANATSIASYLELSDSERPVLALPFHYSFGLSIITSHLTSAATLVIPRPGLMTREFWHDVREGECTSLSAVPYSFRMFERVGLLQNLPTELKTMTQAGGRLDPLIGRRFYDALATKGARLFIMYGQTEATARISYVPPATLPDKIATIGIPIPGGSITIENREGLSAPIEVEGELVYTGANVMMGYATGGADLQRGDVCQGVLRTGDLGVRDSDNFIRITGRKNRIAKVFGLRVALDDIEAHLDEYGTAAAVSADERIVIYCDWQPQDFHAVAVRLASRYGIHHSAFEFRRMAQLPTNENGKVDYGALA